jgi:hypothetical protein
MPRSQLYTTAAVKTSNVKSIDMVKRDMILKAEIELKKEAAEEWIRRRQRNGNTAKSVNEARNNYVGTYKKYGASKSKSLRIFNESYNRFINWYVKEHIEEKEKEINKKIKELKEEIDLSGPLLDLRKVEDKVEKNLIKFPSREEELAGLFGGKRNNYRKTRKVNRN